MPRIALHSAMTRPPMSVTLDTARECEAIACNWPTTTTAKLSGKSILTRESKWRISDRPNKRPPKLTNAASAGNNAHAPQNAIPAASSDECCDDAARQVRLNVSRQPGYAISPGVFVGGCT